MRSIYPLASQTRQPRPNLAGGGTFDHVEKLVLHTTETAGWPGYPDFAPHLTYDPWKHQWNQHFSLEKSATTLVDAASTKVRENRDFCIQVEIVAYADPKMAKTHGHFIDDIDDQAVHDLADLAAWLHATAGLELRLVPGWLPYPQSYGNTKNRMTGPEYDAFRGVLGHEHVSTNVHGDPGAPPWLDQMLAYAKTAAGQPSTPSTPTTGKGLDMAAAKDIFINYEGNQVLVPGDNEISISSSSKTLVIGPNDGIDVGATITAVDASGARVPIDAFFRVVSYKDGSKTTTTSSRDSAFPVTSQAFFKGDISADKDKTRSPRLRLIVRVPEGVTGLVAKAVEVTGWKL